jgi:hypothetical protein
MSSGVEPEASTHPDEINGQAVRRSGKRWEVQLGAIPSREWREELFKTIGEFSRTVAPRRLEFDQACVVFERDEDHVKPWIESIDKWFASTNARHRVSLERAQRDRSDRHDADAKERERIQQMNDRFRNL